jgi:hypothetical protein
MIDSERVRDIDVFSTVAATPNGDFMKLCRMDFERYK